MRSRFDLELPACSWPRSFADLLGDGITADQLRGPHWRRTSQGYYVPIRSAHPDPTPTQRIVWASPVVPPDGAVTGWAAAFVHGADQVDGIEPRSGDALPVSVCLARDVGRRHVPGVHYLRQGCTPAEIVERAGLRVTVPDRAALDAAASAANLAEAVAVVDGLAHVGVLRPTAWSEYVRNIRGRRGVALARRAAYVADAASRGVWESRLRVYVHVDLELPRPRVNVPVFHLDGRLLGIPDLLLEDAGVVIEFDGAGHRQRRQHRADNVREERFEAAGLVVVRVDSLDLLHHLDELRTRLLDAFRRGVRREHRQDRWTVTPPSAWLEAHAEPPELSDELKHELFGTWRAANDA